MLDLNVPQPPPTLGEGDEVWPLIFANESIVLPDWLKADMRARHELGVKKYGTPLKVWNGRDCVIDAYQEALDLAVYVQQARARLPSFSLTGRSLREPAHLLGARLTLDLAFHSALQRAEVELRAAQLEHNGSLRAVERYRAARSELAIAEAVAAVLVSAAG